MLSSEGVLVAQFYIDYHTMVNTPEEMSGFTATLRSRTPNTDLSSILTTTARVQINGYTVVCADAAMVIGRKTIQLSSEFKIMESMIIIIIITNWCSLTFILMDFFNVLVDPPSPPIIIDVPSSQQRSAESVVVTIEWNPPVNNGGADIHNYTVSVSPSTQLSATVVTSTTVNVTTEYNVNYTLSIVATNCAGNSDPAVYIFSVGKFCEEINVRM